MLLLKKTTKSVKFGKNLLTLETGMIARQATAAVMVDLGGTTVLVTLVADLNNTTPNSFFPLRVDYQEKFYAAGKIPGGFFKREGRPSERETLIARLIDRPIRPLFADHFTQEVQIVATVLSLNPEIEPDIPALIGASAVLALGGLPISEIMAAARVGYNDGCYILNPTLSEMAQSKLDLVVAGTKTSVLMVESEAQMLSEDIMLGAVMFGHTQFQPVIKMIEELADECGREKFQMPELADDSQLTAIVKEAFFDTIKTIFSTKDKVERTNMLKQAKKDVIEFFNNIANESEDSSPVDGDRVIAVFNEITKNFVRDRILAGELRIDGRDLDTVRPIYIETGVLPRTHGSAIFTRGETQALVTVTLGSSKDAQVLDSILGEQKETFIMQYNFPPFSVGEIGQVGSPKRREIGHGKLAKRGLQALIPDLKEFNYVVRLVSEITESNGSSSMASVCGGSLALMDAGVPIKDPVAGVAMGLIKEGDRFAVLTDIQGDEDHLGDMDFKVAGTEHGVTALQMDIKISGITQEIMRDSLAKARKARLHILGEMNKVLSTTRSHVSQYAPRILTLTISKDKIRDVIGKGGSVIKGIIDETGAVIEITDDGVVQITANSNESAAKAMQRVKEISAVPEVNKIYEGTIVRIEKYGAFVNFMPGCDGLVHVSQIADKRVEDVAAEVTVGQNVKVKVIGIDEQGKIKLSMRDTIEA